MLAAGSSALPLMKEAKTLLVFTARANMAAATAEVICRSVRCSSFRSDSGRYVSVGIGSVRPVRLRFGSAGFSSAGERAPQTSCLFNR